jgi:hypothetical protein
MESITLPNEENKLDRYIFIVYTQISKYPSLGPNLYPDNKVDKTTKK